MSTYVRVITTKIAAEAAEEFIKTWKRVITGKPADGWLEGYLVYNSETSEIVAIGLWETEAHATAYEASGRFREDARQLARFRTDDARQLPSLKAGALVAQVVN